MNLPIKFSEAELEIAKAFSWPKYGVLDVLNEGNGLHRYLYQLNVKPSELASVSLEAGRIYYKKSDLSVVSLTVDSTD